MGAARRRRAAHRWRAPARASGPGRSGSAARTPRPRWRRASPPPRRDPCVCARRRPWVRVSADPSAAHLGRGRAVSAGRARPDSRRRPQSSSWAWIGISWVSTPTTATSSGREGSTVSR
ncbi:hypothetical protein [Ornithinimicrobium kibberense]|uniref:hypothetical protein n=1 Tax=Ornithinimicrobium kibberense TaxID=282060 RepID=UPI00361115B2